MPGAYSAAFSRRQALPRTGGNWSEVTNRPYDSDDPRYRDPFYSNSSGGATWSRLSTGLPVTTVMDLSIGPDDKLYAATHGGGSWSIAAL